MRTGLVARGSGSSLLHLLLVLTALSDNCLVISTPMSTAIHSNVINSSSAHHNRLHLQRAVMASRKFACREPQPRAYNLRDLMQSLGLQNSGESANQPVYMVLKRCDGHSGCCMSPDMSCSPIETSTYYDDVEIEIWSLETNTTRRQWIRVEQHGKCSCEVTNSSDRERLEAQKPNLGTVGVNEMSRDSSPKRTMNIFLAVSPRSKFFVGTRFIAAPERRSGFRRHQWNTPVRLSIVLGLTGIASVFSGSDGAAHKVKSKIRKKTSPDFPGDL